MRSKDFLGSLTGFGQHFKCSDNRHGKIVVPESMVVSEKLDAIQCFEQQERQLHVTSVDAHEPENGYAYDQKIIQQVTEHSEDEHPKDALDTDHEQQAHQDHFEVIPGTADLPNHPQYQKYRPPGANEQYIPPSISTSSARPRVHAYDSPNGSHRDQQKLRYRHSIQDDCLLGHHSGGGGSNIPLYHQLSLPGPDAGYEYQEPPNSAHQPQVSCIGSGVVKRSSVRLPYYNAYNYMCEVLR